MLTKTLERDSDAETSWRPLGAYLSVWRDVHRRALTVCINQFHASPRQLEKYSPFSYTWHVELEAVVNMWLRGK